MTTPRRPLGRISTITMGQSPKGETYNHTGDGLPLLNGPTEFGATHPHCTLFTTDPKRNCEKGDLIFCVRGSTTGRMNWADRVYALGRGVCSFRAVTFFETRYVRYAIEQQLKALLQLSTGASTFPNLSKDDLHKFEIPWANNRSRIAAILSAYDDLIENNTRRIAILEEMARRLYEEWFVHFRFPGHEGIEVCDGLPMGWHRVPIKETYTGLYDGPHATPPPSDEGPVFLGIGNITETGRLDLSRVRHISEEDFSRWTRRVTPQAGDIVFTYEATLNRYALIPEGFRGCLGRRLALIRSDPKRNHNRFLYLSFFTADWRQVISSNMLAGATVDRIPLSRFPDFPINLPPEHLVVRFDEVVRAMFDQILALQRKNANLRAQRDLLLPKLISGEIDVSEIGEPIAEVAAE